MNAATTQSQKPAKNEARAAAGRKGWLVMTRRKYLRAVAFWVLVAAEATLIRDLTLWNVVSEGMRRPAANAENFEGEGPVEEVTAEMILPPPLPIQVTWDMIFPNVPRVAEVTPPPLPIWVTADMIIPPPLPVPTRRLLHFARQRALAVRRA